jgi:hypothetical protein
MKYEYKSFPGKAIVMAELDQGVLYKLEQAGGKGVVVDNDDYDLCIANSPAAAKRGFKPGQAFDPDHRGMMGSNNRPH